MKNKITKIVLIVVLFVLVVGSLVYVFRSRISADSLSFNASTYCSKNVYCLKIKVSYQNGEAMHYAWVNATSNTQYPVQLGSWQADNGGSIPTQSQYIFIPLQPGNKMKFNVEDSGFPRQYQSFVVTLRPGSNNINLKAKFNSGAEGISSPITRTATPSRTVSANPIRTPAPTRTVSPITIMTPAPVATTPITNGRPSVVWY